MNKISANIVADSISIHGDRVTTFLLTFPRFILPELNTHRMFSRNSASSRAIPFEKMVKMVEEDPFIPIAWQKDHKGMQGTEYFNEEESKSKIKEWLIARDNAVTQAKKLHSEGVTKQLCNRLLEPFLWHTVLLTATEFENFFKLRCPQYVINWYPKDRPEALEPTQATFKSKEQAMLYTGECSNWTENDWRMSNIAQAEIHMQALAEAMWDAYNKSTPVFLRENQWHIPYRENIDKDNIDDVIKIATARCARLSYMTFDNEIDYEKDIKLHDKLIENGHLSPLEHICQCLTEEEYQASTKTIGFYNGRIILEEGWCGNLRGFKSYRYIIENGIYRSY
jgi:thymidylate synthase ThyX